MDSADAVPSPHTIGREYNLNKLTIVRGTKVGSATVVHLFLCKQASLGRGIAMAILYSRGLSVIGTESAVYRWVFAGLE